MAKKQDLGSLRDFLSILFKHKSKIVAIFLATVVTVTIVSFLIPPVYEAKSSILVKFGREYIYQPEVGDKSPLISINQEEVINSEINILMSRDLIEQVITGLKVENIYPELVEKSSPTITPIEAAILKFTKKLAVEGIKKSHVIELSFQHKNPEVAAKAVNLLVDLFKEKHLQVFSNTSSSFLDRQLISYELKLKESENKLEVFKQKNQVFSLDEQRSLLLKQHMELDTSLKNTLNHMYELQNKLSSLKGQMKTILENEPLYTQTERDKIITEAKGQLLTLQLKEQDLLRKYKETNKLVVNARKGIDLVKNFLKEQEKDISNKVRTGNIVYQELEKEKSKAEAELSAMFAKSATLRQQLSQIDRESQSLDLHEKELQSLKREQAINDKNYRNYVDKSEEARISEDLNRLKIANISVIQAAVAPIKPIKPKKALNIVLGAILGAVSGLGYAFLSEYTSQRISTPDEAEKRLGLPVLTAISYRENKD